MPQTDVANTIDKLAIEHEADQEGMKPLSTRFAVQMYDGVPEQMPVVGAMLKGKTDVVILQTNQQLKVRTGERNSLRRLKVATARLKRLLKPV